MAKIAFNKLGLTKMDKVYSTIEWNEQVIEIKRYLPIQEKLELITRVIDKAIDASGKYYNIGQLTILLNLEIIYAYTNISFTDKQKEDFLKTYDLLESNGLIDRIMLAIDSEELSDITVWTHDSLKHIYEYNNSLMGILENMQNEKNAFQFDLDRLKQEFTESEDLQLVKDIAPLLNLA